MSQNIAVIVKDGQNIVSTNTVMEGSGATGRPLIIKAGSKQSIELKNVATQVAPDQIHVTKHGKDLHVKFGKKVNDADNLPDVIIEGFYDNEASLIGVAENGQYYNFIPQEANPDSSYYSLGGDVIGEETATDWLPLALGLLGAGALAALAGGGGGGGSGDTTPPDSLTVALNDDLAPITGPIVSGGVTNDTTPVISGVTEAGAKVTAKDDTGNILGTATADGSGNYTITPTTPLSEGQHYISVTAADAAGNDITVSSVIFTVDETPPAIPVLNPTDGSPITGTAEAGSTVTITDSNGNPIGTTTANQNGNFSYTPATPVPDGTVINATATDAAGNESGPGTTTVNSTILEAPIVYDDVTPVIGQVFNGESTNDARPTFSGSLATSDAGSTIEVFDGATSLGTTKVQANGSWSLTPTSVLAEGTHSVTYTKDGGSTSPATSFTVDTIAPTATTNITAINSDTGTVGDFMTSDTTLIISGTNTAMNPDEKVQISFDGGTTWVNATQSDATHWSYDNTANAMTVGGHTLQSRVIDAASNVGTVDTQNITIEPPAIIDLGDDGNLIHPVFVDGNWYYYWDKDGDGVGEIDGGSDYGDTFTHDELDAIFIYDVNGGTRPSNLLDTNDTYRYDTINGYHLALPTFGGSKSDADPQQDGTVINNVPAGEDNPTYNDLVAIWDAFNGGSVTTNAQSGVPAGWSKQFYLSATPHDGTGGHWAMDLTNGLGGTHSETDHHWVAVQVIF